MRLPSAAEGVSLQLWEWGDEGPPRVLLHGFGMSARIWDPIARALSPCRVLAPDARGHGDSDHGPAPDRLDETAVDDVTALADALGLERFGLAGHSMGAATALRYCARHPERVERLVLLDAGPDLPDVAAQQTRPVPSRTPPITGFENVRAYAEALGVLHPRARPDTLRELALHWLKRRPDGRFEPKLDPRLLRPPPGDPDAESVPDGHRTGRLWSQLEQVRCPILIVRGELSTVLSEETARRMLAASHDGRLVELAGSGHSLMLDAPQTLGAALRDFLG